ncbi:MAG: hypothetical protein P4L98_08665 [Ancalomicrobiaceae bacterium]|nr:hypothetical protein [Ancalomicrobiaceae bacterium]
MSRSSGFAPHAPDSQTALFMGDEIETAAFVRAADAGMRDLRGPRREKLGYGRRAMDGGRTERRRQAAVHPGKTTAAAEGTQSTRSFRR